jgi:glutaconate CoA-transferase subunit B
MQIEELFPGVTAESVQERCGFALGVAGDLRQAEDPSPQQLALLRDVIDPQGVYIGAKSA